MTDATEQLLRVDDLTCTLPGAGRDVIDGVTFGVERGEVLAVVGPSGCGKTTTLRAIMGFERPSRGRVRHGERVCADCARGIHLPPQKRGIGIVFQDYALFPHLSVIRNVMFGISRRKFARKRRRQIAREALWMVGLPDVEDRAVQDLSGGQQQRVALARAVAPGADVLLLDEPFSNLDPDLRQATRAEVRTLAERGGLAVVLVTHDQEEALSLADRLCVMRDGVIQQTGRPEEVYARPRTAFVARFLGQTNLIAADASGESAETIFGAVRLDRPHEGRVLLSIRPEDLTFGSEAGACGRVTARRFKGHDLTYHVHVAGQEVTVQTPPGVSLGSGESVRLRLRGPAVVVEDDRPAQNSQTSAR